MADLTTTYMGIPLSTPLVVAASSISSLMDRILLAEQAGAGALVIRSLFEEQIQMEALKLEERLSAGGESFAEALSLFPTLKHGEAKEHLHWIEKARAAVKMPLLASLNAVSPGAWTKYAALLEATGVDALELNVYAVAADPRRKGAEIELELCEVLEAVRSEVRIPVAVKLSPFYTSTANVAALRPARGEGAARRRDGRPDRFGAAQEWHPLSLDDAPPARGLDGRTWLRQARGLPGQVEPEGRGGAVRPRTGAVWAAGGGEEALP